MLDYATPKLGEPLNVIISAHSDPYVLTDSGLHSYAKSIGFSEECLGLHFGNTQLADLGDGTGPTNELFLARQYYFPVWGTCWESVAGGNHFRAWKQNGSLANSGAWFLAVSKEESSGKQHTIVEDGYNIGRDLLVESASSISHHSGKWWKAVVEWNEGDLLLPGAEGAVVRSVFTHSATGFFNAISVALGEYLLCFARAILRMGNWEVELCAEPSFLSRYNIVACGRMRFTLL